jgi:surfactin synthase thioesterase subunit
MDKVPIVAIPYAGGDKYAYRTLQKHSTLPWHTLELPGRGLRRKEPALRSIALMASDVGAQLEALHIEGDYVLYGHSMGAMIAHELCLLLTKSGSALPKGLILSGRAAPQSHRPQALHALESDAFWRTLSSWGGVPEALLSQPDMLAYFEPIFKADFEAIHAYRYVHQELALQVPLYLSTGSQERFSYTDVEPWFGLFSTAVIWQRFEGGHFFILQQAASFGAGIDAFAKWVCRRP